MPSQSDKQQDLFFTQMHMLSISALQNTVLKIQKKKNTQIKNLNFEGSGILGCDTVLLGG